MAIKGQNIPTMVIRLTVFAGLLFLFPLWHFIWLADNNRSVLDQTAPPKKRKVEPKITPGDIDRAFTCAAANDPACINQLIDRGLKATLLNKHQQSLYEVAVVSGSREVIQELIRNTVALSGADAYFAAIKSENWELLKTMTEGGLDLNQHGRDGRTPLIYAVEWGDPDVVELLLKRHANPEKTDRDGKRPMDYAFQKTNEGDFPDRDYNYQRILDLINDKL